MLDIKYRFTCGDSDLSKIIKKCLNIMTRILVLTNTFNLSIENFENRQFHESVYCFSQTTLQTSIVCESFWILSIKQFLTESHVLVFFFI